MSLALVQDLEPASFEEIDQPLYVLKFGSSVFRTLADLSKVAGEIYRHRRAGRAVIAVVSAFPGQTDQYLREAASVTGLTDCRGVADLVSLGEERTAALLRLACDRIGLRAEICRPEELGLRTGGDALAALPDRLEEAALVQKLSRSGLVIVPGFVGIDETGERSLLGRGGSDYSAIFIGGELKAKAIRLYKDVDGVFEDDPARHDRPNRFSAISWADALRVARPLVQPQAVEYAADRKLVIQVAALGSDDPTLVGSSSSSPVPAILPRRLRVSLAGYGVVGQAIAERLQTEPAFEIVSILVRDVDRPRAVAPPVPLTASRDDFVSCPTDIIVDALSCEETGNMLCNMVLPSGVHIVSASKRVISANHASLTQAALQGRSRLLYSAAVGGSATILETVDRARSRGDISEMVGVLNGTVNFILQRLAQGRDFSSALEDARKRGFAEENPDSDLSGADAAAKLKLIANRAIGIDPGSVTVFTVPLDADKAEEIRRSGERWVQAATLTCGDGKVEARVNFQPLREIAILPTIVDEWNCAAVKLKNGEIYRCIGRGAGGAATAEAIVADMYELLRGDASTIRAATGC